MAKIRNSFILLLVIFSVATAKHPAIRRRSRARAFIEFQCQATLYQDLCVRCLSNYIANFTTTQTHEQLAHIALKVSLSRAQSTRAYVTEVAKQLKQTKAKDYRAVEDCLDQINDGVDQLTNCIKEVEKIKENGGSEFPWHASNVETWMSTAQSDASICIDGFSGRAIGGKTKAMIKAKVLNLEQVTSISLALFNRYAARYRPSHATKPKV
ncbi:pectinesterase inhibitor 9-like [Olea europaea var. sylvestris]|uniref:pectinesterase inhibitor 9-like n=1 Tax=Olea europaea var. sylvestris TaxID=158386 RepID=UPI000C1CF5D8|nr:pectinesterase inhibitor 9-like [Olea europaea var. sylvestris]